MQISQENNDVIRFIMETLKKFAPGLRDPASLFSDGCIEDADLLLDIFSETALLLCAFHIIFLDIIPKIKSMHGYEKIKALVLMMRDAKTPQMFDSNWTQLQREYPAAATFVEHTFHPPSPFNTPPTSLSSARYSSSSFSLFCYLQQPT